MATIFASLLSRTLAVVTVPPTRSWWLRSAVSMLLVGAVLAVAGGGSGAVAAKPAPPDFGPNVLIFDPSMAVSEIKAKVDAIANQQLANEFGSQRYALLFKPGTYGSAASPLNFQVGYYTAVAGLGKSPTDVVINGSINVYNRCRDGKCFALDNFWRSLSNLTINVSDPPNAGCYAGNFWAVSQASPMRRVKITGGNLTLMDYCTNPSFASGGFIADSQTGFVINGSQQQYLVRDSSIGGWSNGVWNQVFSGVVGAPAPCFPAQPSCGGPYTTLATSTVTRESPYLYVDASGDYKIFVPSARRNSSGTTWASGPTRGESIPMEDIFVARPSDNEKTINKALSRGKNVIFTPGIYTVDKTIKVKREGTVVLGLGLPTLIPQNGVIAMEVADVESVGLAGLVFDAGPVNSPLLLQVGRRNTQKSDKGDRGDKGDRDNRSDRDDRGERSYRGDKGDRDEPTVLHDVFFRIGGAAAGKATLSLEVNSDHVILDNIWAWRADHGNGVGWTINTADTGVIVNGDSVTAYGLFVEHYQKYNVIWNGNDGRVVFFQNEMPYDPPSQAAWMSAPGVFGWAALKINDKVKRFNGYAMGSYSFFNQGLDIYASNAFEAPSTLTSSSLNNLLTIFLDPINGRGGILNVINGIGGPSTIANPDIPVTVQRYP